MTSSDHATRFTWAILMIGVAASGILSCGRGGPSEGQHAMAVSVVAVRAAVQPIEEQLTVVGTLAANESVGIQSELDGVIEAIGFEEGETVEAGRVLFRIDQRKLEAQLAEAQANLELAEATLLRYEALAQSRAVSRQEVDQAHTTYDARRAAVELMRAHVAEATITAPFAGIMSAREVSAGQYVARGQRLTWLIDADPMKVEFHVPERYVSQLAPGQRIHITVAAYPQQPFTGEVYFIDPQIHPATRTILVKALVPNPDGTLRSGMFANLSLVMQVRQDAVVIPETALMVQGQTTSVYVIDEAGNAQLHPVTTGIRLAGLVEILDGVRGGETIVIEGVQKLSPGAAVHVRYEEHAADDLKPPQAARQPATQP